jgi:DNA-binding CsgD family transcriptional regulator
MIFADEKIELLISQARLSEASAALTLCREEDASARVQIRRLRGSVSALAGDDRGLARVAQPDLLACRAAAAVAAHYNSLSDGPDSRDHLMAGVVLTWSADARLAYDAFREAYDRAVSEGRFYLAVTARERLSHHALLFGDIEIAQTAIGDAVDLAAFHGLTSWWMRCIAAAARLALDTGDLDRAAHLLDCARSEAREPNALALFAPIGAQLAVEMRDDEALLAWTSAEIVETALRSDAPDAAIAATMAALAGAGALAPGAPVAIALRRALLQAENVSNTAELFSMAARYGELDEAQHAADALGAVFAPHRRYLKAHYLLARAHLLFRYDQRANWVDYAGDAARAFNAMGMRRWTNEAMSLLVRQEGETQRIQRRGRPPGAALTGREQQVAHLIRRGARNREVAHALQISEHTVERHVSSILGRLGLRSRWQIVDPKKVGEP